MLLFYVVNCAYSNGGIRSSIDRVNVALLTIAVESSSSIATETNEVRFSWTLKVQLDKRHSTLHTPLITSKVIYKKHKEAQE